MVPFSVVPFLSKFLSNEVYCPIIYVYKGNWTRDGQDGKKNSGNWLWEYDDWNRH
ncbi:hypothetical protein AM1BK_50600 [Neobacillus kokaensis]|uniref:Uncharacterized protein n=1 Tax=Neobacillus kokaensis TaxID=2759023 RepID=A0ABQ3NC73_9BACI|nr:hypothetical protein AM1BK_50600 [Neobacillus kokaensis]